MPRLRLLANGSVVAGAYDARVILSNSYSAGRFEVVATFGLDQENGASFWSSATDISIDIQVSVDGGASFTSLVQGLADTISIDPVDGLVRINGRDYTAALIGSRTQETFSNRTSSEIATLFARRHGLIPCVTPTTTPVGRFYQSDHESLMLDRFSQATTEWDLLVYLARQEGYDAFIIGTNLFFQPTVQVSTAGQVLRPTDMIELRLERMLTLAGEMRITVRSWNSLRKTAFLESVSSTIVGDEPGDSGQPREFIIVRPNLTPDKALAIARQKLLELSRHERRIEFSMPGELVLTPRSIIQLAGTGTAFDQSYYIESIERVFRSTTGFLQHIRANNSSPRSEILIESAS